MEPDHEHENDCYSNFETTLVKADATDSGPDGWANLTPDDGGAKG